MAFETDESRQKEGRPYLILIAIRQGVRRGGVEATLYPFLIISINWQRLAQEWDILVRICGFLICCTV